MIFVFKNFELDEELYELRRKSVALRLEPKAFDVLLHLVRHRDHVV
jgi:DNA-binding winged helix-turn-helix (wHTH) protein